jgi:alpha-N-acetylglucosamine transferase
MSITIITRTKNDPQITNLVNNILKIDVSYGLEVVVIDSSSQNIQYPKLDQIIVIRKDESMFNAKLLGLSQAKYDKVLFLDSDQLIEKQVLDEIEQTNFDAFLIKERSANKNLMGKILDWQRKDVENYSFRNDFDPRIPAVPRAFSKHALTEIGLDNFNDVSSSHEDSIFYHAVYPKLSNIKISKNYILNYDPSLLSFIKKSYIYGRSVSGIYKREKTKVLNRQQKIIKELNQSYIKMYTKFVSPGFIAFIVRAIPYILGAYL